MTIAYSTAEPLVIGKPFVAARVPGGRVVQALHLGSWQTLLSTYDRLSDWLGAHRVLRVPLMWEEYLVGPDLADDPAVWQTRVVVPLHPESGRVPA
jgi:effector-binding domain-containing protein